MLKEFPYFNHIRYIHIVIYIRVYRLYFWGQEPQARCRSIVDDIENRRKASGDAPVLGNKVTNVLIHM